MVCVPESPRPVPPSSGGGMVPDAYATPCASTDGRLLLLNITTGALTELDGSPILDGAIAVACSGTEVDYELVCASTDGRLLKFDAIADTFTELDGSPILDGATGVPCSTPDSRRLAASEMFCVQVPEVLDPCGTSVETFTFPANMVLDIVRISSPAPGIYNIKYVLGNVADADYVQAALTAFDIPDTRVLEDIGPGFQLWVSDLSLSNVTRLSPLEVGAQLDTIQIPGALPGGCVDPAPPGAYATANGFVDSQFSALLDGQGTGPQVLDITFEAHHFTAQVPGPAYSAIVERRKWQEVDGTVTVEDWLIDSATGAETLASTFPFGSVWAAGPCDSGTVECGGGTELVPLAPQTLEGVHNYIALLDMVIDNGQPLESLGIVGGGTTPNGVVTLSNAVDGVYWAPSQTQVIMRVPASCPDGFSFTQIDDNAAGSWLFGTPVTYNFATDPTGSTFATQLIAETTAALIAMGVPFSQVVIQGLTVSGTQVNFQLEIEKTTPPAAGLAVQYLISPSYATSTFQFQPQDDDEADWVFPAPPILPDVITNVRLEVHGDWSGVLGPDEVYAGLILNGKHVPGTWNFGGAAPYMTLGTHFGAGPTIDTFDADLTGSDVFTGAPYTIVPADLNNMAAWLFVNAIGNTQQIDGLRIIVEGASYQATGDSTPADLVVVCPEQITEITDAIAAAGVPTPVAPVSPRFIAIDDFGFASFTYGPDSRSFSIVVLSGSVTFFSPFDGSFTLLAGEQYQWDGPFISGSLSVQGNSVGTRARINYEGY